MISQEKQTKKLDKITKVSLVIYFLIILVCFIVLITHASIVKNYIFLYAFLLCLGPGIIFVLFSFLFTMPKMVEANTGKGIIAWYIIAYVIKYGLIVAIPIVGISFPQYFHNWTMLAITIIAPVYVIIIKLIFANYVSKNAKNQTK